MYYEFALDQVVTIFNLFIAYGDEFLVEANTYDFLYYELIRHHDQLNQLLELGLLLCSALLSTRSRCAI